MPQQFAEFLPAFFNLYEQNQFSGQTFLDYVAKHSSERSGDEASVVDNVLSGPLLTLLGFPSGEQVYNATKSDASRPDFAPRVATVGDCFVVEDKSTSLDLTLDLNNKDSHLSQLAKYVRGAGAKLGLLSNGRDLRVWEFSAKEARELFVVDVVELLKLRAAKKTPEEKQLRPLESLFDLLRREAFTSV